MGGRRSPTTVRPSQPTCARDAPQQGPQERGAPPRREGDAKGTPQGAFARPWRLAQRAAGAGGVRAGRHADAAVIDEAKGFLQGGRDREAAREARRADTAGSFAASAVALPKLTRALPPAAVLAWGFSSASLGRPSSARATLVVRIFRDIYG